MDELRDLHEWLDVKCTDYELDPIPQGASLARIAHIITDVIRQLDDEDVDCLTWIVHELEWSN